MYLGVIADDITGATDVALMLTRGGMRTVQVIGVPDNDLLQMHDAEAVVVALKSRTCPVSEAVSSSLAACDALLANDAQQILFKYCSTFDSTSAGNIGPVADALLARLDAKVSIICPAFPAAGRTVYQGHLFVGSSPLDESSMRNHPLTPMLDSSVVRLMQAQTRHAVRLLPHHVVAMGERAVRDAMEVAASENVRYLVADAIQEQDLRNLAMACALNPLITGGSGIAIGLPSNFGKSDDQGKLPTGGFGALKGRRAIISGSCSATSQRQVEVARLAGVPSIALDPLQAQQSPAGQAERLLHWAQHQNADAPILIYSTAQADEVAKIQSKMGQQVAAHSVENCLSMIAKGLVENGYTQLIVAGGETSGAVVQKLQIKALAIGPEIDPGIPWTRVVSGQFPQLVVALKSGNFGSDNFFLKAWSSIAYDAS